MVKKPLAEYAPLVLRLGMAGVFAWFGASQLMGTHQWTSMVPEWAMGMSGLSASTIVRLNGGFEILATLPLVVGVWTRWVALVLFVHLLVIASDIGMTPIGVRDLGLCVATLAIALYGDDQWCLTYRKQSSVGVDTSKA